MSDIVNRLRTNRDCLAPCLMDEAADEIVRLERVVLDLITERDAAADAIERLTAERDKAHSEIIKINDECTKLACRNAILVLQYERVSHEIVRVKSNIEAAIRRALYEGEG